MVVADDSEKERRNSSSRRQESMRSRSSWLTNFHRDLMAGFVMGGVVHTIVAPIERAKLLLQTQESNMAIIGSGRRRFKGMLDCIVRTVREEGILSLWRGNGSSVLRYYPSVALNFSLKVCFLYLSTLPFCSCNNISLFSTISCILLLGFPLLAILIMWLGVLFAFFVQ